MDTAPHNLDPTDEALLTAYALGECDSEADRAAAERLLAQDPAARRAADEVRAIASTLTEGLKGEPDVGLTAIHVAGIERRLAADAEADAPHPVRLPLRRNWGLWGSVAASTLIVATVMATVLPQVFRDTNRAGPPGKGGGSGDGSPPATPDVSSPSAGAGGLVVTTGPAPLRPDQAVAAVGGDANDWPILKTSAGGLPWPAVVSRESGLYEPAFVVPSDFPLAIVPPTPAYPQAVGQGTFAALRSALAANRLPPPQSVRADELVNHLNYEDLSPGTSPVVAKVESAVCPWNSGHLLVRVTVRNYGYRVAPPPDTAGEGDSSPLSLPPLSAPSAPTTPSATLPTSPIVPLVRDLRLAIEVNPAAAAGYRVIGYENGPRSWGEWAGRDDHEVLAAGTTFTALLEVVPAGQPLPESSKPAAAMKYGRPHPTVVTSTELLTVGVEYREGPAADPVRIDLPVSVEAAAIELASADFRAAAGAAAMGLSLRQPDPASQPALAAAVKLLADVTATSPAEDRQALLEMARLVKGMVR